MALLPGACVEGRSGQDLAKGREESLGTRLGLAGRKVLWDNPSNLKD